MIIRRKSVRPEAALRWLAENGLQDVATENLLDVRMASDRAVINLSGSIGKSWWDDSGITAKEFDEALNEIPQGKKILLRINSEGGSIKEGLGIYDSIKARSGDITARNVGYALSIASVFPLAASRIESPDHAIWMTHEGWMTSSGNKRDMLKNAEMLGTHDKVMAGIYAKRTGKSEDYWASKMESETWFTGQEAIDAGLADETGEEDESEAQERRTIFAEYLKTCRNIPANIFNMLSAAPQGAAKPTPPNPAPENPGQPQDNTMNKTKIVALLKDNGIKDSAGNDFTVESPDNELESGLASLAKKPGLEANARMETIEGKLAIAEKRRITDKVNGYVDSQKITKAEVAIFVAAALTDEEGTFKILDEKEIQHAGGDAAGYSIEIVDSPSQSANGIQGSKIIPELNNIFESTKNITGMHKEGTAEAAPAIAVARYNAMKAEFPRLLRAAFRKDNGVMAANTFSGTITTNFLIMGVITKLYGRFAPAALFTRDATQDPYKPLAAGIRKFNTTSTDGSQVGVNVTNFETLAGGTAGSIDSNIDAVTITPAQYTAGGYINNAQLNSGFRIADEVEAKLAGLAAKTTQVLTAPITVANFVTNAPLISAPAAFGFSDLATLQGVLKKTLKKNLLLDGEYQARIANQPGFFQTAGVTGGMKNAWAAYGWDNIALNTDWSGAGANVRGFGCGENAIGIISGLPLNPPEGIPGNIVQTGVAMIPDVELGIATYAWFSPSARSFFFTYDLILGATLIDETQGVLVKSA